MSSEKSSLTRYVSATTSVEDGESLSAKVAREGHLLLAGATGFGEAASDAFRREQLPSTFAKVAASAAIGLAMARFMPSRGLAGVVGKAAGVGASISFASDILSNGDEIVGVMSDAWQSSANMDTNVAVMQERLGRFGFDSAMTIAAGTAGGALGRKIFGPKLEILSSSQLYERTQTQFANKNLFDVKLVNGENVRRLHYLSEVAYHDQTHFTLSLGRRIIGVGGVQVNPYNPSQLWMQHVSVEPQFQGNGYARQILTGIYEYAAKNNLKVVPSSFSKMGQRLKHIHNELDARYPQAASGIPHKDL